MWIPTTPTLFEAARSFDHTLSSIFMTSHPFKDCFSKQLLIALYHSEPQIALTFNLGIGKINMT